MFPCPFVSKIWSTLFTAQTIFDVLDAKIGLLIGIMNNKKYSTGRDWPREVKKVLESSKSCWKLFVVLPQKWTEMLRIFLLPFCLQLLALFRLIFIFYLHILYYSNISDILLHAETLIFFVVATKQLSSACSCNIFAFKGSHV